ncbi:hypothetical protein AAFC00_004635 [Neodothiora populina]|uniref:Glutathione S-transferase n=1 Tax=Neodothiora populina TaxID=2781224 RepID=A0ABR3P2N4_9PEZI
MPNITLYFLQASRSIRTAWQLEELNLDYKVEFADREGNKAPQHFKTSSGDTLGKFPVLKDDDLTVAESGAIAEYLCDHYDPDHRLLPTDNVQRAATQRWVHAAEGTFGLHGLAVLYARWSGSDHPDAVKAITDGLSVNVGKDLDFLESELAKGDGRFLVGDHVTIADCMMLFSVQFILARDLGVNGRKWDKVDEWIRKCEATESYQTAVRNTGHTLDP